MQLNGHSPRSPCRYLRAGRGMSTKARGGLFNPSRTFQGASHKPCSHVGYAVRTLSLKTLAGYQITHMKVRTAYPTLGDSDHVQLSARLHSWGFLLLYCGDGTPGADSLHRNKPRLPARGFAGVPSALAVPHRRDGVAQRTFTRDLDVD